MSNETSFIFNISNAGGTPLPGSLLIAEPFLRESHFNHAVIALIDHGPGRTSMGLVLNHPAEYSLSDLVDGVSNRVKVPVYNGGPVSTDRLFFLHTLGSDIIPNARQVKNGLWIGGDFEAVKSYIRDGYPIEGHIRFFIGYSGWDDHQLSVELSAKVWTVAEFSDAEALLTGEGNAYWHNHVRLLGPDFRAWLLHPQNPRAN